MESPGTAPGSEPCIMGAFIAIVRVAPHKVNIGGRGHGRKAVPRYLVMRAAMRAAMARLPLTEGWIRSSPW